MMSSIPLRPPRIETLNPGAEGKIRVDVLRLDEVHPLVSGNKWFKLQRYLQEAQAKGKKTLATFGGAYSNHILATAAAARAYGFNSIGIIRGEAAALPSPTLSDAANLGMQLIYIDRNDYRNRHTQDWLSNQPDRDDIYLIDEGGYGAFGAEGAATLLQLPGVRGYDYLVTAVGTGTTLAGLASACEPHQHVIGIPVLKNAHSLTSEIEQLLSPERREKFSLIEGYHFGGYARHTPALLQFMNDLYADHSLPTDFVYTGKLFYAVRDLLKKNYWPEGSRLLIVHSGGLQGNRSLPKGTLIF